MALIETLTDNFNDNSIDAAKWNVTTAGSGTVVETGQQLVETTILSSDLSILGSDNVYDLTGSQATVKIIGTPVVPTDDYFDPISLYIDSTHFLNWEMSGTEIYAQWKNGGSTTTLRVETYDADTYRYVKIRESGGTCYWDYSADGLSWTNFTSVATPITITGLYAQILLVQYGVPASIVIDDFNILPSAGGATGILTPRSNYWGDL